MNRTGAFRGKKHQLTLPVSVYLIEHPKGLILIDTGWHTENRKHQFRNLSFQWFDNKAELLEGKAVNEQLASLGYKPEDIDKVILSYLHCDHADGLRLVKDAKEILVSKEEFEAAKSDHLRYLPHEWKGVDLKTFNLEETGEGPHGRSYDVFGDGTVEFVWIPGHSKGLCATIIKNKETKDFVLLASDVGYSAKNWEENLTPGVVVDRKEAQRSLGWLRDKIKDPHCVRVIANHDPEVSEEIIEL